MSGLDYVGENMYLYQQKEFFDDYGLNLHYFNARMFDSELGRFRSNDPLIIFASPYNGMGNNPVSLVDPSGMGPTLWQWIRSLFDNNYAYTHNIVNGYQRHKGPKVENEWGGSFDYYTGGSYYSGGGGTNGVSNHSNFSGSHGSGSGGGQGSTNNAGYTDNRKPRETKLQKVEREISETKKVIDENDGKLTNNSNEPIYYKIENGNTEEDWKPKKLDPGESTDEKIDGINVKGKVYKVVNGYNHVTVTPDNKIEFDYPFFNLSWPRVYELDDDWLHDMMYKKDGTPKYFELPNGEYVEDKQWWYIFNP